jgi:hypothetical protein
MPTHPQKVTKTHYLQHYLQHQNQYLHLLCTLLFHGVGIKGGQQYFNKPLKCVPPPPSAPKPTPPSSMPVSSVKPDGNKRTKVAVPYISGTPLCVPPHTPLSTPGYHQQKKIVQSKHDTARKTHLGPLLCTTCNVYGHTYTTCKHSVHHGKYNLALNLQKKH